MQFIAKNRSCTGLCNVYALTWKEFDIMAISIFNSTIILQTLYDPNISKAQNRVNSLIPVSSKSVSETSPNDAQNNDCDVSNKLANRRQTMQALLCNLRGKKFYIKVLYGHQTSNLSFQVFQNILSFLGWVDFTFLKEKTTSNACIF